MNTVRLKWTACLWTPTEHPTMLRLGFKFSNVCLVIFVDGGKTSDLIWLLVLTIAQCTNPKYSEEISYQEDQHKSTCFREFSYESLLNIDVYFSVYALQMVSACALNTKRQAWSKCSKLCRHFSSLLLAPRSMHLIDVWYQDHMSNCSCVASFGMIRGFFKAGKWQARTCKHTD